MASSSRDKVREHLNLSAHAEGSIRYDSVTVDMAPGIAATLALTEAVRALVWATLAVADRPDPSI